jgi:hypothetical protein
MRSKSVWTRLFGHVNFAGSEKPNPHRSVADASCSSSQIFTDGRWVGLPYQEGWVAGAAHSPLMPAAFMIGHHLSISAFW